MDPNRTNPDLGRLYERNVGRVFGFLAYRLGDREAAEDLTQVTFERAVRAYSRFDRRRASEQTWLLAIARNALIDYRRRGAKLIYEPLDEQALPALPGPESEPAGVAALGDALARLPDRDREVLALRYGAEMTGPEIAQLLGLSVANVHQITSRSLRKLREALDPTGGGEPAGDTQAG